MTSVVLDAIHRLSGLRAAAARWQTARAIMADVGGEWMTLGSAPPDRPTAPAVLSSTPAGLMQDYIGQNLQQVDHWMAYSARNMRPLDLDPGTGTAPGGPAIDPGWRGCLPTTACAMCCWCPAFRAGGPARWSWVPVAARPHRRCARPTGAS